MGAAVSGEWALVWCKGTGSTVAAGLKGLKKHNVTISAYICACMRARMCTVYMRERV